MSNIGDRSERIRKIIEQLGMGAFGTVWKARDTKLDRTVAIKIPHQGQLDGEDAERFLREATAAAQWREIFDSEFTQHLPRSHDN